MTIEELRDIVSKLPRGSVNRICQLAGVSRMAYYRFMSGENKSGNLDITKAIMSLYSQQSMQHLRARVAHIMIEKLSDELDTLTPEEFKLRVNEIQKEVYGPTYDASQPK